VDVSIVVIERCRKLLMIDCGTYFHSCIASRQFLVELTELPVMVGLAFDFFDRSNQIFGFLFASSFLSPEKPQILWEL
jgi:glucosamine 6-phosphate synthetase-like amidotransferase/phosphosugar isomerase protein